MKALALLCYLFLLLSFPLVAQEERSIHFPEDYFGIYTGILEINSAKGLSTYPMEFHLQSTDTLGTYSYKLVYGAGDDRQERPYFLVEKNKEAGEYVVDENNGIMLDDKVIENRMYALFEVGDNLLTTFITFEKDYMVFEIAVTNTTQKRVSYANTTDSTQVTSYPISTVQRAVLRKN